MDTLKNTLISFTLLIMITACGQNPQANSHSNEPKKAAMNYTGPFDLSRLLLKENILEVMTAQKVKPEQKLPDDKTLFGSAVFKSSDPKVLIFGGEDLSGQTGKNKNYVLFHYHESSDSLAFFELTLYNKKQTAALIGQLEKLYNKPLFEQIGPKKGATEIDEQGNAVKPEPGGNYAYRVWENKQTGLTYFLLSQGNNDQITTKLTALKRSEQSGKEWVASEALDWYEK